MIKTVNVFLPMRAGSERVPRKNTKFFAGINGGLCEIKLSQLLKCKLVENIYVSTDDSTVVEISKGFNSDKIIIVERPGSLATSSTSTDDLISYVPEIMPEGHILWTHATSPFINEVTYSNIIDTYYSNLGEHDSLMTVTPLQKFIWDNDQPVNYNRLKEKWPRTQTISPLWEINSGAFIATRDIYLQCMDRIGIKPFKYQLDAEIAFDIDWLPDFKIAEILYNLAK